MNYSSCGFISLIQLLSFYDTFYNDEIIPENYEKKITTATSFSDFNFNSPGVKFNVYNQSTSSYFTYCNATINTDYQSFLTVRKNQINGTNSNSINQDGSPVFRPSIDMTGYQDLFTSLGGAISKIKVNVHNTNITGIIDNNTAKSSGLFSSYFQLNMEKYIG